MRVSVALVAIAISLGRAGAAELDERSARMLDAALQQLETFRKESHRLEYDATIQVNEWDGRGRLRGNARAQMVVRPGAPRPINYISREVHGKVRLPDDKEESKDDGKEDPPLQQFARDHRIEQRFDFNASSDTTRIGPARQIQFTAKPNQPEKDTADRFLNSIAGSAWIAEGSNRLAKFQMKLQHPFQLLWIFAVLKELSIDYELLEPQQYLGHARINVRFCFATPVYTIRQEHQAELSNFRPRSPNLAAR